MLNRSEESCIFCEIIRGESPVVKVFEDEQVLVFLDHAPFNKGHLLVIPKEHHSDMLTIPSETLTAMMNAVKKLAKKLIDKGYANGFNVLSNNGAVAGQTVFHSHFHIIPRLKRAEIPFRANTSRFSADEMEKTGIDLR